MLLPNKTYPTYSYSEFDVAIPLAYKTKCLSQTSSRSLRASKPIWPSNGKPSKSRFLDRFVPKALFNSLKAKKGNSKTPFLFPAVCAKDCGRHGQCLGSACVCHDGWVGARCEQRGCDRRCDEHGQCINGTCVCQPGYNGRHCTLDGCKINCNGHGDCDNLADDDQPPEYE